MSINLLPAIFFAIGSAVILAVSWQSLRHAHFHGFYRFFAFEGTLAVVALQLRAWFLNPFAWHQVISWVLLILSIVTVLLGVTTLQRMGKPAKDALDSPHMAFEKTTRLVTSGIYRYLRHPMYASLLYLAWGAFFKRPSWSAATLALLAAVFTTLTAMVEERENLARFGEDYAAYMKRTRRFIPFIF